MCAQLMRPVTMRPLEDRLVSVKIHLMVWSTKMDLLAISYANGEVALHRLNWLKVWVLPPPADNVVVKGIAWRPDGKVIAIGYSNREVLLVSVEQKEVLHETVVEADITCVLWSDDQSVGDQQDVSIKHDSYKMFLPKLPGHIRTRSGEEGHENGAKGIETQKLLNMLLIGMSNGTLLISVFGLYPHVSIPIWSLLKLSSSECIILDAGFSSNHDTLLVCVLHDNAVKPMTVDTSLLRDNFEELITLAYNYGQISSCLDYMDLTLQNIIEGWENIMLEMDCKLKKYASKVIPGRVSCDFLELLMFGTASQEMSEFLLDDLTEKGLKKLNHSVEISYVNIQSLVLKHLQTVGQNLPFQLAELSGLARCPVYSKLLGLSESTVMEAFAATGSFLIKVSEVQHVIDESLKKFKSFFRWLYSTFIKLCEERVATESSIMSQDELKYIVDFIDGLEDEKGHFNLDRLGQYLADAQLENPSAPAEPWENLMKKHPVLARHPHIIPHNKKLSLIQEARALREKVNAVFNEAEKAVENRFTLKMHFTAEAPIISSPEGSEPNIPRITHTYVIEQEKFMIAITDPLRSLGYHFFEVWRYETTPYYSIIDSEQKVVDVQYYLPETLSLLLDMTPDTGFAQVAYPTLGEPCSIRAISGMVPAKFAVCGTRKVAVILSASRRKIKMFEMDTEEDDNEEVMDTSIGSGRDRDVG